MNDVESMAICLYAAHRSWLWEAARGAVWDMDIDTKIGWYQMAQAALDHIEHLPSGVAAREKLRAAPPYHWLGADALACV